MQRKGREEREEKEKKQRGKGREGKRREKKKKSKETRIVFGAPKYLGKTGIVGIEIHIELSNRSLPNRNISRICKLYEEKTGNAIVRCPVVIAYREKGEGKRS